MSPRVHYNKAPCCENAAGTPGKIHVAPAMVFQSSMVVFTGGQDVPSGKHTEPVSAQIQLGWLASEQRSAQSMPGYRLKKHLCISL